MDKRRRSLFRRGPAAGPANAAQAAQPAQPPQPAQAALGNDEDATLELANALATDMVRARFPKLVALPLDTRHSSPADVRVGRMQVVVEREDGGGENEEEDDDAPIQGTLSKLGDKGIGARMWKQRFVYVKDGRLFYAKKQGCAVWSAHLRRWRRTCLTARYTAFTNRATLGSRRRARWRWTRSARSRSTSTRPASRRPSPSPARALTWPPRPAGSSTLWRRCVQRRPPLAPPLLRWRRRLTSLVGETDRPRACSPPRRRSNGSSA